MKKKLIIVALLAAVSLLISGCFFGDGDIRGITVYITETGEKYHRWGCQYLRQSCIPISLAEAKRQGYTPCKVCKPPL